MWARLIVKHVIHMSTVNVVEYRSVSRSMSSANLKTSTLSITTMLSWTWSMSSTTWRNQICHTTTIGWCGARYLIVSQNISNSSRIVRNRDFGSVSVMFRVTAEQENRRHDENAYRCVRLSDELSHVVLSDFSYEHGNIETIRAVGNPPKTTEKTLRSSENASEFHN